MLRIIFNNICNNCDICIYMYYICICILCIYMAMYIWWNEKENQKDFDREKDSHRSNEVWTISWHSRRPADTLIEHSVCRVLDCCGKDRLCSRVHATPRRNSWPHASTLARAISKLGVDRRIGSRLKSDWPICIIAGSAVLPL